MKEHLEYIAKAGLIRAGPLEGFLATVYNDAQRIQDIPGEVIDYIKIVWNISDEDMQDIYFKKKALLR